MYEKFLNNLTHLLNNLDKSNTSSENKKFMKMAFNKQEFKTIRKKSRYFIKCASFQQT